MSALYLCNKLYSFQPIAARLALLQLGVKRAAGSTQAPVINGSFLDDEACLLANRGALSQFVDK